MEPTWKEKHVEDLKKQRRVLEQQIELDKKLYAQNLQTLKEMSDVIEKLGIKQP